MTLTDGDHDFLPAVAWEPEHPPALHYWFFLHDRTEVDLGCSHPPGWGYWALAN